MSCLLDCRTNQSWSSLILRPKWRRTLEWARKSKSTNSEVRCLEASTTTINHERYWHLIYLTVVLNIVKPLKFTIVDRFCPTWQKHICIFRTASSMKNNYFTTKVCTMARNGIRSLYCARMCDRFTTIAYNVFGKHPWIKDESAMALKYQFSSPLEVCPQWRYDDSEGTYVQSSEKKVKLHSRNGLRTLIRNDTTWFLQYHILTRPRMRHLFFRA